MNDKIKINIIVEGESDFKTDNKSKLIHICIYERKSIMRISIFNILFSLVFAGIIIYAVPTFAQEDYTIPKWIKNTAGWWSDDITSDKEFVNALQFLIDHEILRTTHTETFTPSVVISTDKNQYKIGEKINITISNNGNVPISTSLQPIIEIFSNDGEFIALFSTPSSHFELMDGDMRIFSWNQKQMQHIDLNLVNTLAQVDPGKYQIKMTYYAHTNITNFSSQYTISHYIEVI